MLDMFLLIRCKDISLIFSLVFYRSEVLIWQKNLRSMLYQLEEQSCVIRTTLKQK
jgi:hypothetical protein